MMMRVGALLSRNLRQRGQLPTAKYEPRTRVFIKQVPSHQQNLTSAPFGLFLYLTDPTNNKELCEGSLCYDKIRDELNIASNRRLYSYIKGAHGYAVLHYTIFDSACQATVEIRLHPLFSSGLPIYICGSVFATYSNQSYSSRYAEKYYRSLLFCNPHGVELDSDLRIPLSKSVVVAPEGVGLVVEVDLNTSSSSGNLKDIVYGKKEFRINLSRTISDYFLFLRK